MLGKSQYGKKVNKQVGCGVVGSENQDRDIEISSYMSDIEFADLSTLRFPRRVKPIYMITQGQIRLIDSRITLKLDRQHKQAITQLAAIHGYSDPSLYAIDLLLSQVEETFQPRTH